MGYAALPMLVSVGSTVTDINKAPSNFRITAHNTGMVLAYVQLFNAKAADVVLGTTAATYTITALPGDNASMENDVYFNRAVSVACTTTATGAVAAPCHISPSVR